MTPQAAGMTDVRAAYRHCEQVTRTQARNFSYGIRLLPAGKRRALSAVYALARRIDDIGDGTLPPADKLAALKNARETVAAVERDGASAAAGDPVLVALADAATRYPVPLGAFGDLIDGCEADVRGTSYATWAELEHYCRCVAGSIGRLSLGVFGSRDFATAEPLADDLGVALQLTNILRDIREDLINGRVYLPAEDLDRFGAVLDRGRADDLAGDPALEDVVRFEARRAFGWYATGLRLLPMLDRRSAASAGAMAGIYLRLTQQITADPAAALRERQSLPGKAKAGVAFRALAGIAERVPEGDAPSPRPVTRPSPGPSPSASPSTTPDPGPAESSPAGGAS
jgi:15-cis-phytoene synthase